MTVSVPLPGRDLSAAVWVAQVGRVPVLLLDTDVPDNDDSDRPITHILYVRGREMRLHQELVLGVGGVRALRELGPGAGRLAPQRGPLRVPARRAGARAGRRRVDARRGLGPVRRDSVFTIHTPVSAGNERFDADLVRRVARPLLEGDGRPDTGGIPVDALLELGLGVEGDATQFDMTAFSLRLTRGANAVSQLHAETANATWTGRHRHDILGITNGIHTPTWVGQPMRDVLERWSDANLDRMDDMVERRRFWDRIDKVPGEELWEAHQRQKLELAIFARGRLRSQFARHGEAPSTLEELEEVLDPSILTIGFARRFATYKRAALLFTDIERLARMLWDEERPMQIIFAGKAHPADRPGQGVIQDIFSRSRSPRLRGRVFIMEDYDIRIGRFLVQGVDVWLNNPRRPLEASGTSGMKASANGIPNLSVLDGWWDEGWTGDNGWAIGGRETNPDEGAQDWSDAQDLYRILEEELIPAYYERDATGLPAALDPAHAQRDRQQHLAVLDHPDAPRVRGAAVPAVARRRRHGDATAPDPSPSRTAPLLTHRRPRIARAPDRTEDRTRWPPASRWPSRSTTTSRWATSAGCSRRSTTGPTCRCSRRSSATRASACRSTTRARSSSGSRAERPEFLERLRRARRARPGGAPGRRPVRAGAGLAPRARPRGPAVADGRHARADHRAAGRAAPGSRSASGSRTCRRRSRAPATSGRSSTTSTSAPPRSPRRTCGARTRPRTRATC